ncbi:MULTISPECIES: type VI secretion system Vgr family protein [unclassified Myroides]|uniref:type VI secretion system Vgr family protein n=1 Tax=unclassified Myroides TaxID=2642485 RepID=UPI003D2F7665
MKEKFTGAAGTPTGVSSGINKGVQSDQLQEALVDQAASGIKEVAHTEGLSHLEQLVKGIEEKKAANLAKAQQAASYGTTAYQAATAFSAKSNTPSSAVANLSQPSALYTGQSVVSNAEAIANHTIFGVNHLVKLTIVAEGKEIKNFSHFELKQSIKGHHQFVLTLSHDALGGKETHHMEQAQELLGKRILVMINFKNITEKPERDFVGVITEVSFEQAHGSRGYIVLKGSSPTVLLDAAPHIQSFGGSGPVPLATVVNQLLEEGYTQGGKYNYKIKMAKNYNLSYTSQYNETHYNFLARMAEAYGEQFFYDGDTLHFGDLPHGEKPIQLVYGRDVEKIQVRMVAQHVNRLLYGYNSLDNEKLSAAGDTKLQPKGTLAKAAYKKSEQLFTTPSLQQASIKASTNQDVTQAQRGVIGSVGMSVFTTSGVTTVPFLYPGCIVELSMVNFENKQSSFFTRMMITSIEHTVDTLGNYQGRFEAVDAETGFIPRVAYHNPTVEQQVAEVVNNTDPQNKGRVQVRFDWQNTDQNTEFIRVMTPDAGSSDKVGSNRGFMAIPEVGDQVMVGFIGEHPDRPYVMGGLFHGGIGAGGGVGNNIKSLSSKSGHTLELNDGGGITVVDKDQNYVFLSGDGHIAVESKETISMTCGKSTFYMDKEGKIAVNGIDISTTGENIEVLGSTQIVLGIGQEGAAPTTGFTATATKFELNSTEIGMVAQSSFSMGSVKVGIQGTAETVILGGKIKLN